MHQEETALISRRSSLYGIQDCIEQPETSSSNFITSSTTSSTIIPDNVFEVLSELKIFKGQKFNSKLIKLENLCELLNESDHNLLIGKLELLKRHLLERVESNVVDFEKIDSYYSSELSTYIQKIQLTLAYRSPSNTSPSDIHPIKKMPEEAELVKKEWLGGYLYKHKDLNYFTTDFLKDRESDFLRLAKLHKVILCEGNVYAFECKGDIPKQMIEDLLVHHMNKSERPLYRIDHQSQLNLLKRKQPITGSSKKTNLK